MMQVRNIREFTVAISQYLNDHNETFNNQFDRLNGMMFTLPEKVNHTIIQFQIIGGKTKPFSCRLLSNGEELSMFEAEPNMDFEKDLDNLFEKLLNFRLQN